VKEQNGEFDSSMKSIHGLMVLCLLLLAPAADARSLSREAEFDIPAQDLSGAVIAFSEQSGIQVVTAGEDVTRLRSPGVQGRLQIAKALEKLLSETTLGYKEVRDGTVALIAASAPTEARNGSAVRLAQENAAPRESGTAQSGSTQEIERLMLEEIVVTATKRLENVHDVPMSIAVIGDQDIERRGLIGMEDYLRSIPGVNQIDNGPLSNAIVIRGITTSPEFENFTSAATVASYFDETPITGAAGWGAAGIDVRPVDIERIEILRGPQGTAYGAASLGGAIRMIPAKPKLDAFSARLAGSLADTSGNGSENSMLRAVVNIPVVQDKFAMRAVGYRFDESGYYRNIAGIDPATIAFAGNFGLADYVRGFVQDDVGDLVSTGGRLSAFWKATDALDITFNYLTQKIEQDGRPLASAGTYEQTVLAIAPQSRVRGEAGEIADTDIDLANLVLNYDAGWATLTSVASWVNGGSVTASDLSSTFPFPSSTTAPSDFESRTFETRIASKLPGRVQFLAGLFYENVDESTHQTVDWPGTPATSPLGNPMLFRDFSRELEQSALFGEVSYQLTQKLTATVGGRYFKYDKTESQLQEGLLAGVPIGSGARSNFDNDDDDASLKANLKYAPTGNTTLYASWAEGFRLGRPAAGLPAALCDLDSDGVLDGTNVTIESTRRVNSDTLDNYEIGGKFALLDRRVVLDAAVYHIKWEGLPTTVFTTCSNIFQSYTANAGKAESSGIELQTSLFVTDGLRIDVGGAYTKAELAKDSPGLGSEGARLPGSPKVSANLSAQYDFPIAGYSAFVRGDSMYTGKFYGDLLESPGTGAGDYFKLDARLGITIKNVNLELFVRNLTNEDAFTWRGLSNARPFYGYRLRPRTVGVQLGYAFE
jgi:iron complex outermembrane recepter protein